MIKATVVAFDLCCCSFCVCVCVCVCVIVYKLDLMGSEIVYKLYLMCIDFKDYKNVGWKLEMYALLLGCKKKLFLDGCYI